eukprot:COSAG03_NODE_5626_length_1206_cov_1.164408_1_plen_361_part_10
MSRHEVPFDDWTSTTGPRASQGGSRVRDMSTARRSPLSMLLLALSLGVAHVSLSHGETDGAQDGRALRPVASCPRGVWDVSGRVSVSHCNATGDGTRDALAAFQACAQLAASCGAILEVPPGKYWLNGSLHLSLTSLPSRDGALRIEGISPATLCRCPGCLDSRCEGSPTVLVGDPAPASAAGYEGTDGVYISNLFISGTEIAVRVVNAAGFRMQDVRLQAGRGGRIEPDSPNGHPSTAALSVENSFELSFLRCQFYGATATRPSVLLRGLPDLPGQLLSRVPYVYIVSFRSCSFVNGGVSYVQLAQLDNVAATDFSFVNCLSEQLAMPLLQVVSGAVTALSYGKKSSARTLLCSSTEYCT